MAMWYAVVNVKTGELWGTATEVKDTPDRFKVIELGKDFIGDDKIWDIPTQSFVKDPSIETPEELYNRMTKFVSDFVDTSGLSLTTNQKTTLKDKTLTYFFPNLKVTL